MPVGDVLAPWRELLAQHANDVVSSRCPSCWVDGCDTWRWAGERLAEAEASKRRVATPEAGPS